MDPEQISKNETRCKYLIGHFPEQFNILFDILGEAKHGLELEIAILEAKGKVSHVLEECIQPLTEKDQLYIRLH